MAVTMKQVKKFVEENSSEVERAAILQKAEEAKDSDGLIMSGLVHAFLGEKAKEFLDKTSQDNAYIDLALEDIQERKGFAIRR